uniref:SPOROCYTELESS-like EAR-containing protein 3 n=1 Tax=Brachypodium distachyon TaxID=15368 RepID=A0A482CNL7_BRADI|nr:SPOROCYTELESS-like EAR-containing protein 3 [Brachypodium distachyon]
MEWGRVRSSPGSRRGKKATGAAADKPRQPQRGLGVAQLEKIRLQSEMAEYLHHPPPGGINLMAYNGGRSGDRRYGESPSTPFIRKEHVMTKDSVCFRGHYDLNQSVPVDSPSPSMNSDDQQDVDLELKL